MADDDFYNQIGAFRVASEPKGSATRRRLAKQKITTPPNMGGVVFHPDGTYTLAEETEVATPTGTEDKSHGT